MDYEINVSVTYLLEKRSILSFTELLTNTCDQKIREKNIFV